MRLIFVFNHTVKLDLFSISMKDSNVNEQERQSNFIVRHEVKVMYCSVAHTCVYRSR